MSKLDIGCGDKKCAPDYIGIDKYPGECVDVVHDIEEIPWPCNPGTAEVINASHVLEHIAPNKIIDVMNEAHRVMVPGGHFLIKVPDGRKVEFLFDPTHRIPWTPETFAYFTPDMQDSHYYNVYKPKPWSVMKGFPVIDGYPAEFTMLFTKPQNEAV